MMRVRCRAEYRGLVLGGPYPRRSSGGSGPAPPCRMVGAAQTCWSRRRSRIGLIRLPPNPCRRTITVSLAIPGMNQHPPSGTQSGICGVPRASPANQVCRRPGGKGRLRHRQPVSRDDQEDDMPTAAGAPTAGGGGGPAGHAGAVCPRHPGALHLPGVGGGADPARPGIAA